MTVTVIEDRPAGEFRATLDGQPAGLIGYRRDGDVFDLLHTEVDGAFEGHGVGTGLVRQALAIVRTQAGRVRPSCPFVRRYLEQHPGEADLE